jgi:SYP5 family syntaxin
MLPITNPRGGGDARSSSSSSSSSALDQWTKRFQEAERLVDDVVARIAERESVPPTLPRELQRRTAEIRRKVTILGTRLDMLREDLSDLPKKQNMFVTRLSSLSLSLSLFTMVDGDGTAAGITTLIISQEQ